MSDTATTEPTDSAKQRILLFGDSMAGTICYRFAKYAEQNGHVLECATWASTTTHTWAKGDKIRELIDDFHPTYVFVCLGSNELYSKDMDGMEARVKKIVSEVGDIPVIWIGPPNWCQDGGINKCIERVMGRRAYFPSKNLSFQRLSDGHHPTNQSAAKWMDAMAKWIRDGKSIHPILMTMPANGVKGKMKLIVIQPENGVKKAAETKPAEGEATTDGLPATGEAAAPAQTETTAAPAATATPTKEQEQQ